MSAMTTQSGPMLVDNGMADDFSNDLRYCPYLNLDHTIYRSVLKTAKRRASYDSLLWPKTGGFKRKDIRMDFVVVLFSFLHREETLTTFYALF